MKFKNLIKYSVCIAMLATSINVSMADDDDEDEENNNNRRGGMRYNYNQSQNNIPKNFMNVDVVVVGNNVAVRMKGHAMTVLGTEMKPVSMQEKSDYTRKVGEMRKIKNLGIFPSSAKCSLKKFKVKTPNLMNDISAFSMSGNKNKDTMMDMQDSYMGKPPIMTTVFYNVYCKNPKRLSFISFNIFDVINVDSLSVQWKNSGMSGYQNVLPREPKVLLYADNSNAGYGYGRENRRYKKRKKDNDDD